MHDGAIVLDADLRIRQANPQARALLGAPLPIGELMTDRFPAVAIELARPPGSEPRVLSPRRSAAFILAAP